MLNIVRDVPWVLNQVSQDGLHANHILSKNLKGCLLFYQFMIVLLRSFISFPRAQEETETNSMQTILNNSLYYIVET